MIAREKMREGEQHVQIFARVLRRDSDTQWLPLTDPNRNLLQNGHWYSRRLPWTEQKVIQ